MTNKRNIHIMWIISVIPAVILAVLYAKLPDVVPTNFSFDGEINSYGPKHTLWFFALICPLMAASFQWLPGIDPKRHNYVKFQKYYDLFAIFMELFMLIVLCLILTEIFRPGTFSIGRVVTMLLAVLFMLVGNMMGKVKQNFYFGIKTPWTLSDPDVWTRTHSLCGKLWFAIGVLMVPCVLLLPESTFFVILMVGVILAVVLPCVYSYLCYRRKQAGAEHEHR